MQCTQTKLTSYFDYLDRLRESGRVNMFGAAIHLHEDMDLSKGESRLVLSAWMSNFDGETTAEDRATSYIAEHGEDIK